MNDQYQNRVTESQTNTVKLEIFTGVHLYFSYYELQISPFDKQKEYIIFSFLFIFFLELAAWNIKMNRKKCLFYPFSPLPLPIKHNDKEKNGSNSLIRHPFIQ